MTTRLTTPQMLAKSHEALLKFYVDYIQTWQTAYVFGIACFIGGITTDLRPFYWFAIAFFVLSALEQTR